MNKILIFMTALISMSVAAMERPAGSKRGAPEIQVMEQPIKVARDDSESESELPSSATERQEPVSEKSIRLPELGLQDLPNELVAQITLLITNAKGNTNDQKLITAAIDINNLAMVNKAFREFFKSYYIQLNIIKQLAAKYAKGDVYAAAFALATNEASDMIGSTVNESIRYNEDENTLEEVDPYLLERFKDYLADAIKRKKEDAWLFFTKHVAPLKLAFIIDSLMIDGKPALVYAIDTDNKVMLGKILAVEDININRADAQGRTPLMAAIDVNNTDLIRFLTDQNDVDLDLADNNQETALFKAVKIGNLEYVNLFLEKNVRVNLINNQEYTPLMIAILNARTPIIRRLLQVPEIDVNLIGDQPNFEGPTTSALHHAAQLGNLEIMRMLLAVPTIQLNILNSEGQTPLHIAAIEQKDAVVDQLIRSGAQVNIQDAQGMTPLMYAAGQDAPLSVYYLVNAPGVDLNLTDAQGHTALWHARNAQKPGNIAILQSIQAPE